ncbi:MAG: hypothetical protein HN952_07880 [Candidatus Cloacimonetes bacterium]|nr:hypothetical protein [Candidatus Cloacimonadota bacterium]MBT7468887.1 hypothetical protein [Candidatus Cloacimonadota bacterium]
MKMTLFWGAMLILWGLSLILKAIFKIDLPIFRIVFAIVVIYWGLKLLLGGFGYKSHKNVVFMKESKICYANKNADYSIIFGSGDIDLSNVDVTEKTIKQGVDIVFGSGRIILNSAIPTVIKVSTVFADSKLPKGSSSMIGDNSYHTESYVEGENYLQLNVDVVFGSLTIIEQ